MVKQNSASYSLNHFSALHPIRGEGMCPRKAGRGFAYEPDALTDLIEYYIREAAETAMGIISSGLFSCSTFVSLRVVI